MKTIIMASVLLLFAAILRAETSSAEGRRILEQMFYADSLVDDVSEIDDVLDRTFSEEFGTFQQQTGWQTNRIVMELCGMVTNKCADLSMATNAAALMTYGRAVHCLGKFGGTNALAALDYVIRHGYGDEASGTAIDAYVNIAGRSAEAFEYYSNCMIGTNSVSNDKMTPFFVAVTMKLSQSDLASGEISNRVNRLVYAVATNNVALQISADRSLCRRWPGYDRSFNRKRQLENVVAAPETPRVQASAASMLAELNALTNLVELSVDDFISLDE